MNDPSISELIGIKHQLERIAHASERNAKAVEAVELCARREDDRREAQHTKFMELIAEAEPAIRRVLAEIPPAHAGDGRPICACCHCSDAVPADEAGAAS